LLRQVVVKRQTDRARTDIYDATKILIVVGLANILVVISVDIGYVVARNSNNVSSDLKAILAIFTSAFVFAWNQAAVPGLLRLMGSSSSTQFKGRLLCLVCNLLVASTISTFVADPGCYRDLFYPPPKSISSFTVPACTVFQLTNGVITCLTTGVVGPFQTEFLPPFLYSHNCYSAVLVNYSPVVFYMSLIQLVFLPMSLLLPAVLLKDGSLLTGVHRMLWVPTKTFTPNRKFSYFKLPKFFSAYYYYLCEALTFGLACPIVMFGILSAFIMEVSAQVYFIR